MTFFGKILIAADDTAPSRYAIDVAIRAAHEDQCAVVVAVALDPSLIAYNASFASIRELAEQIAYGIVDGAMQHAQTLGVQASSKVFFDDPTDGIIDLAKAEGVGLIAMGTHGRRGLMRALIRSIAEEVLRSTTIPLCVVRRPAIGKIYHRLLVPIVDDDLSQLAIGYAIDLGRSFGARLLFSTVENAAGKTGSGFLDRAKEQAAAAGVQGDAIVLARDSSVAQCILNQAHAAECDAIVMASHGRDGFSRILEGSVAETVIRSSQTPVIVLRDVDKQTP